jgi:multiple sugar transport system permease protein
MSVNNSDHYSILTTADVVVSADLRTRPIADPSPLCPGSGCYAYREGEPLASAEAPVRRKPFQLSSVARENLDGYVFILPWLVGFLGLTLGPMVASLYYSLTDYPLLSGAVWIGLGNYRELFSDRLFPIALRVTFLYSVTSIPLSMALAMFLALLLNVRVRGILVFRTVYYLPTILGGVAVSLIWMLLFSANFGLFNWLLSFLQIEPVRWLTSQKWALWALVFMSLWGVGGSVIIFLAGLQNIPSHLYEAARIDGASTLQEFRYVTVPQLTPTIFFMLVMGVIGALQTFTQSFIMTGGGPNNATLFYVLMLYRNAFQYFRMGYASAMAWILFLMILLLTLLVFQSSPMWVYYEASLRGGRRA